MPVGRAALDELPSWAARAARTREELAGATLRDLFAADPARGEALTFEAEGLLLDARKQRVTPQTLDAARRARARGGPARSGSPRCSRASTSTSPRTARRCTSRCALRAATRIETGGEDVVPAVHEVLDRMAAFAERVRSGAWTGATGRADPHRREHRHRRLATSGPRWRRSRSPRTRPDDLELRFLSNVDGSDFWRVTRGLDPAEHARDRRVEDVHARSRR